MKSRTGDVAPTSLVARNVLWNRLNRASTELGPQVSTPVAAIDLDAFDANAVDLTRRAQGTRIRVASKSLRVPELIRRALEQPGFSGVLGYTLREALFLVGTGVSDDVVVAYPSVDRGALAALVADDKALAAVTLMVDDLAHLELISEALRAAGPAAREAAQVRLCLDVDAGLQRGGAHIGPKRSPLLTSERAVALAREIESRAGMRLVGVMTYEGQVAGVPDDLPGSVGQLRSRVVRQIKRASVVQLREQRATLRVALAEVAHLEFFNAGGSGSLETSAGDPSVTEVTAGSGLLVPALFDHFEAFTPRPAAFFGLPVTRRPAAHTVTVHGGGLIASGASGSDRLPTPWAPPGLRLTGMEGAGEVQTPLVGSPASGLSIGDLVWFRHAKSGELFEHVTHAQLLSGDRFVGETPTYRGWGQAF